MSEASRKTRQKKGQQTRLDFEASQAACCGSKGRWRHRVSQRRRKTAHNRELGGEQEPTNLFRIRESVGHLCAGSSQGPDAADV
jgi:hypothetical protein